MQRTPHVLTTSALFWLFVSVGCSGPQEPCPGGQMIEIQGGTCYSFLDLPSLETKSPLEVADFNGDAFLDLVVGGTLWINDRKESFTRRDTGEPLLTVADLNQDTLPDLISSRGVHKNLGNLQFETPEPIPFELPGAQGALPQIADLDNDSDLDLVVLSEPTQGAILLNDGLANFSQTQIFSFPGNNAVTKKLGDFNGDSFQDLVLSVFDDDNLRLLLNDQTAHFIFQQFITIPARIYLETEDLDQNGQLDLLTGFDFQLLLNKTQDPSDPQFQLTTPQPSIFILSTDTATLNQDGFPDVVASQAFEKNLLLYLTLGPALFQEPLVVPLDSLPFNVLVDDLNNDLVPDFIVSHSDTFSTTVLLSQP